MADKSSKLATFRVDNDLWEQFQDIAKDNQTNASALLVRFIKSVVSNRCIDNIPTQSIQQSIDTQSSLSIQDIDKRIDEKLADVNTVSIQNIDETVKKLITESLGDGEIKTAINQSYEDAMGQFNQLLDDYHQLEAKIAEIKGKLAELEKSKPITSYQSITTNPQPPIINEELPLGEVVEVGDGGNELESENSVLKALLETACVDLDNIPLSRNQVIEFFEIQDILDGLEYSDSLLRKRGIKDKIDEDIDHFAKFVKMSGTHHTDVVERFNRILNWLGYEVFKLRIVPTGDGKSYEVWTTKNPQNSELLDLKSENPPNPQSPMTDDQQKILDILGIDLAIAQNPITSDVIKRYGIGQRIKSNQAELEKILEIEINMRSKQTLRVRDILKAAKFKVKGNPDSGYFVVIEEG